MLGWITYFVIHVGDVRLLGRLAGVSQLRSIFGWYQASVLDQRLALIGHLVAFHVHLILRVTC